MYYRRKILLYLINSFGQKGVGKLKLQKLLFLFCQKQQQPAYDFVPSQYGCFSFQGAKDLNLLTNHYGLLDEREKKWVIKQPIPVELKHPEQAMADELLHTFADKNDSEIVSHVYNECPYYAINSQRSLTAEQKRIVARQKEKIASQQAQMLFTIGYEGKSLDAYLNQLIKHNISLLCDVRSNPLSMKYGFSKNRLKTYCEN